MSRRVIAERYDKVIHLLSGENIRKVIAHLAEGPKTAQELSDLLKLDRITISHALFSLRELELIEKEDWKVVEKPTKEKPGKVHKQYFLDRVKLMEHIERMEDLTKQYRKLLKE